MFYFGVGRGGVRVMGAFRATWPIGPRDLPIHFVSCFIDQASAPPAISEFGLHFNSLDSPATPAPAPRAHYARPFEPPTRPAFLALPPGAVEPAGWLRDWCLAARDGYTGHMDEYDDEFTFPAGAWLPP